jgi:putative transcription factor
MDCELCGRFSPENYTISVDGVKMSVCKNCAKYGKLISAPESKPLPIKKTKIAEKEEEISELVDNYPQLIKNAREKMGLSHKEFAAKINETVSVIKKLELGKMIPTDDLVRRIERFAGIKLLIKQKKEEK